jgi:hypothetical protein
LVQAASAEAVVWVWAAAGAWAKEWVWAEAVDAGNNQGKKKANHCFAQEQWIETIFPADKYSYLPPPQGGGTTLFFFLPARHVFHRICLRDVHLRARAEIIFTF